MSESKAYVNQYPSDCLFSINLDGDWVHVLGTGSPYHSKDDTLEFLSLHQTAEAFSCNYP